MLTLLNYANHQRDIPDWFTPWVICLTKRMLVPLRVRQITQIAKGAMQPRLIYYLSITYPLLMYSVHLTLTIYKSTDRIS